MTRTKLKDRLLPDYTRGEEIFNMVTHIVGGAMGVVILIMCLIKSSSNHHVVGILSSIIFGLSVILLYTMSAIYHGLYAPSTAKKVFQIMDHCTIFVLIAGTYTPILLCSITKVDFRWGWILFGFVWGLSVLGIVLNAIDLDSFSKISMLLYLGLGWCIVFKINLLPVTVGINGVWWLVAGGISYTVGVLFYWLQERIKYMHSIWHLLILLGTFCHFICIYIYVL